MSARAYGSRAHSSGDSEGLAPQLAARRAELGLSLADVAARTGLSRAYVNALERGKSSRPSFDTVQRLELALGPIRDTESAGPGKTPPGLRAAAKEMHIPEGDLASLAQLRVRGQQPRTQQRWMFIYQAMLASESMDD